MPGLSDVTALYNAGTDALARGQTGEAVLFLTGAARLEPRAKDVARNLSIAEARVALARGESGEHPAGAGLGGTGMLLSSGEAWLLAALLVAWGALGMVWRWWRAGAIAGHTKPESRALRLARRFLDVAGVAGLLAALLLTLGALNETFFPEAVVLDAALPLAAASGQPLPEAPMLVAGERVRLAGEREGMVEIRLGGTSVGWGRLSGVWRVRDTARYTPSSSRDRETRREGSHG
jgi:hypothetical protein